MPELTALTEKDLTEYRAHLDTCVKISEVFGPENNNVSKSSFRKLVTTYHPDHNHNSPIAASIVAKLIELWAFAETTGGSYPTAFIPGKEPQVLNKLWRVAGHRIAGDICDLATAENGKYYAKVARYPKDNDLLEAERRNLGIVRKKMERRSSIWKTTIPEVHDSFVLADGGRRVNVIERFDGFLSVKQIIERGYVVDGRTLTWMWKRLLLLVDWTYRSGVIHGAVLPPHVLFYPDNDGQHETGRKDVRKHSVRLVDWCYSIEHDERTKLKAIVPAYRDLYAPEILEKRPLGPSTDMCMAAHTLILLRQATWKHKSAPEIDSRILQSLYACVDPDPRRRPQSAEKHFEAFLLIQEQVFGAPKWHDFIVPPGPTKK